MALVYLILGTAYAAMGFCLGSPKGYKERWSNEEEAKKQAVFSYSPIVISIMMLVVICLTLFGFYNEVAGRLGMRKSLFYGIFSTIINMDVLFLIFIIIVGGQWKYLGKKSKLLAATVPIAYVFARIMMASRSGIYNILVFWLLYKLCKDGDPKINVKRLAILFIPFLFIAIISFTLPSTIRKVVFYGGEVPYSERLVDIVQAGSNWEFQFKKNTLEIFTRLSGLDHLILIVNNKGIDTNNYINLENEVKSFFNLILPGRPFRVPLTAQAFGVAYLGIPAYEYVEGGLYTTFVMMMLGLFYAHFELAGGLIAIFMFAFALAILYKKISYVSKRYKIFLNMWFMYVIYFSLMAMGFDLCVFLAIKSFSVGVLYLVILYFLSPKVKASIK